MSKEFEHILALHSSPAICGIKASNLINLDITNFDIEKEVDELNNKYGKKVRFYILRKNKNRCLILIYRIEKLKNYIFKSDSMELLLNYGYPKTNNLDVMLDTLSKRINENLEFPHEIGIFLGYDVSDTYHFIKKDKKELMTGYWKVYSNIEMKQEIFNRYTKCKNCVLKLIDKGFSIENFMR